MKTIVEYINNVINESTLNESSHDAELSVKKVMKDILNKKMTLDEISDILGEEGWEFEEEVPFLYGGSVTSENISEILKITDGVIIGKNSIDIKQVKEILNKITK